MPKLAEILQFATGGTRKFRIVWANIIERGFGSVLSARLD